MRSFYILSLILVAAMRAGAADDPVEIDPVEDTWLNSDYTGRAQNRGELPEMQIYGTADGKMNRALIKFDLKAVPGGFRGAILRITAYNAHYEGAATSFLRAHQVTRGWSEKSATWDEALDKAKWAHPGGDFAPQPAGGARLYGPLGGEKARTFDFEISALARTWAANPGQNYGVAIMLEKGCLAEIRIRSKEFNGAAERPKLLLYYKEDAPKMGPFIPAAEVPPFEPYDPANPEIKPSAAISSWKLNEAVEVKFSASGAKEPYAFAAASALPPGMSLGQDGTLKGKPTSAKTFIFGVTCAASNNKRATDWYRVSVVDPNAPPPAPPKQVDGAKPDPAKPTTPLGQGDPKKTDGAKPSDAPKTPPKKSDEANE